MCVNMFVRCSVQTNSEGYNLLGCDATVFLVCTRSWGTAVAQWLRCCATNRKVAGSIPDGVIGIFH